MKNLISMLFLIVLILLKNSMTHAQPTDFLWVEQAGGADWDAGLAIATDNWDNRIVTGYFGDTATFGDTTLVSAGKYDIFIAKYDSAGDVLWAAQAGGVDSEHGRSVATDDSGNVLVTGHFDGTTTFGDTALISAGNSDIFIVKYDAAGDLLWAARAGGAGFDVGWGIATDDSGNVLVTGHFDGTATFGHTELISAGNSDIFIAKYDAAGDLLWAARAGGAGFDVGWGIATDDSGNSIMTGEFCATATFGDTTLVSPGNQDMFVAKCDDGGDILWAAQAGGTQVASGYGVATDVSNNSIVTGEFWDTATFGDTILVSAGYLDIFIAKYDSTGNFLWAAQAGGTGEDAAWGIASDDSGSVIVTGRFASAPANFGDTTLASTGFGDIFIAKYDAAGGFLWAAQAGGTGEDWGFDIATDESGSPVATGGFSGMATFGDTTLMSAGEYDIFIAKLGVGGTGIEEEFVRLRSFELSQTYPNPFNSFTSLRFWVTDFGMVSLKVYDISGRDVRTLVNERKQPGSYVVLWDGRSDEGLQASSGVYFYRLQAGSTVETRKILFLR